MLEILETDSRRSITAGSIRLVFRWTGDRWDHWLERTRSDREIGRFLATSIEGDPERDDPTRVISPSYQQIHFQENGPVAQALLVGQSGPHHFSAVFAVEAKERGQVSIKVDVADRCRGPVEALASTYGVNARSGDLLEASPSLVAWEFGPDRLTFAATEPAQVCFAEAGRQSTQIQVLAGPDPGSPTRRFLYSWHWDPDRP